MGFFTRLFGRRKVNAEREVKSSDGRVVARFVLAGGKMGYEVEKDGKPLIKRSALGFKFYGMSPLSSELSLVRSHTKSFDGQWETIVGEERVIVGRYNEMSVYLVERGELGRLMTLRFRVFDDGVAFRYEIPAQTKFRRVIVQDELTEFAVNSNSDVWFIPAYQPDRYEYNYERKMVYELEAPVHTPLTLRAPQGYYISLHEAALYNYGAMTVFYDGHRLKADITPLSDGMKAYIDLPFEMPWRVIMIAESAIGLSTNRMVLNLNDPPRGDFSWVRPLKFLGIWWAMFVGEWTWAPGERHGATTRHAMDYVDACVRLGVPGLLIEGWNDGWEGDWLLQGENNKFTVAVPDFDIDKVSAYATKRGVKLVGHHETVGFVDNYEHQMKAAYEYMREHGIFYVKSGYAGFKMTINGRREFHHSQLGVRHYQRALELAAQYGICLNVHEPIKGTGIERTWPNLLTREGARGQEYEGGALSPSHACILPFTRMLAGGMDYTPGIFEVYNSTKRLASTIVRQLAYFVTIYSGMQMVSDRPRFYEGEYADLFAFIREVPVNWERTVPLLGVIGEYYVVARQARESLDWFIGGVTNEMGRRVKIELDFLAEGHDYIATIYRDSDDAHYRENPMGRVIEQQRVRRGDRLSIYMAPGGGVAIAIKKA